MRRALAIIGVAILVALALAVRSRTADQRQQEADEKAKATMYCVKELEAVCAALQAGDKNLTVVTEDAGRTLATLTSPDFNPATTRLDGWLAPKTYIDQANDLRARAGLGPVFDEPSRVLARSPVVAVMYNDRQRALATKCGGQVTWRCVGEQAGAAWSDIGGQAQWGDFHPVLPSQSTATGLHDIAGATGSWFGGSTYASNDFSDPAFQDWLNRLAGESARVQLSGLTPLRRLLSVGPSALGLAGALEAEAGPSVTESRDKDNVSILYPSPVATADVVLAPRNGADPGGRLKSVLESDDSARAFAENGWRVSGQPLADGLSASLALPAGDGLPSAGVMESLTSTWQTAAR
jgi:hypothetical protein